MNLIQFSIIDINSFFSIAIKTHRIIIWDIKSVNESIIYCNTNPNIKSSKPEQKFSEQSVL